MNPEQCTKENSFTVNNKFGKYNVLICNICRIISSKGCSIAEDKNGIKHNTTMPIGEMEKEFEKDGFYMPTRGRLINANYISKEVTSEIDFTEIKMITGKPEKVSLTKREDAKRQNNKKK